MPAAVELFSILKSHKPVLSLFADLLGSAPRLADTVASRPHLLDALIDPALARPYGDVDELVQRLGQAVGEPDLLEDFLDRLREAGQHEMFLVGARVLSGSLALSRIGEAYAVLAEAVIRVALRDVERRFAAEHGRVPGGRLAVRRHGTARLARDDRDAPTSTSIVLYDFEEDAAESDGPRPLNAVVYYTRLTQRLISALTVPTRRGALYARRHAASPLRQQGPGRDPVQGLPLLPAGRGGDLGADGADAGAARRGRSAVHGDGGGSHQRDPDRRARPGRRAPRRPGDARADRPGEGRPGRLGPEARRAAACSTSSSWRRPSC